MIRKQLIFKTDKEVSMTFNYQHDVLRNIYKYIEIADSNKAKMLHRTGYRVESGHKYKLFNFTLLFEDAVFGQDITCNADTVIKLVLSGKKDIVNSIIKGLMDVRTLNIDNISLDFVGTEGDKRTYIEEVVLYSALSPIITSTRDDEGNIVYLSPYDEGYFKNLAVNAKRKYKLVYKKEYEGDIFFEIDDLFNMRDKFVRIKRGGVKGMTYDIWIQAERDMQRVIYYLGLGQNSSIGCGCMNFVKGVRSDG